MAAVRKGDKVNYLPHRVHALDKGPTGDLPWLIGRRIFPPGLEQTLSREIRANLIDFDMPGYDEPQRVEILRGRRIDDYLEAVKRLPEDARKEEAKNIVLLAPAEAWEATVKKVNDDGTLDLEVKSNRPGVTLHVDNVPADHEKATHHTWHLADRPAPPAAFEAPQQPAPEVSE